MAATEESSRDSEKELPQARVVDRDAEARRTDPMRFLRLGVFGVALLVGWGFILYYNKFDMTPPVAFVCIGYLALISAVYALWRTGVVVADENEDFSDSTWVRPTGARGELEREKKSLLKAIKECEFDREMGKLSKVDAEQMITVYRARAIEVIKELDKPVHGEGTVREQIMREVKARLELEEKTRQTEAEAKARKNAKGKQGKASEQPAAKKAVAAEEKAADAKGPAEDSSEEKADAAGEPTADNKDADATAAADAKTSGADHNAASTDESDESGDEPAGDSARAEGAS